MPTPSILQKSKQLLMIQFHATNLPSYNTATHLYLNILSYLPAKVSGFFGLLSPSSAIIWSIQINIKL